MDELLSLDFVGLQNEMNGLCGHLEHFGRKMKREN
jgi:hypothetical protein